LTTNTVAALPRRLPVSRVRRFGAFTAAPRGRGKFPGAGPEGPGLLDTESYFTDQVTGRLVERSGCVCTNLSRRV
jgi:hypothetical protein